MVKVATPSRKDARSDGSQFRVADSPPIITQQQFGRRGLWDFGAENSRNSMVSSRTRTASAASGGSRIFLECHL